MAANATYAARNGQHPDYVTSDTEVRTSYAAAAAS